MTLSEARAMLVTILAVKLSTQNFLRAAVIGFGLITFSVFGDGDAGGSPAAVSSVSPAPSAKLEVDTVAAIPLAERSALLAKMDAAGRVKFARLFTYLPAGGASNAKINALFMAWGMVDALAAVENAKALPTPNTRTVALEAVGYGMKPESSSAVARLLRGVASEALEPEAKERLLGLSIVKWSQIDPPAAAHFLDEVYPNTAERLARPGSGDGYLLTTTKGVAMNWGGAAPQAALAWFQQKGRPENLVAMQNVILGWWRKDAKAAAAYVSAHLATEGERQTAGIMAALMADQNPPVALQWAKWIGDERLRHKTERQIADVWVRQDPQAASQWAVSLSGEEREAIITIVAAEWGHASPAVAAKWIDSLKGAARDAAISGYASVLSARDHKTALEWAFKIKDEKEKERLTRAIANDWLREKPGEARAWVKASKLPEAVKKHLLGLN